MIIIKRLWNLMKVVMELSDVVHYLPCVFYKLLAFGKSPKPAILITVKGERDLNFLGLR